MTAGNVSWKGHYKRLRLLPSQEMLSLPLSACVTKGDTIALRNGDSYVVCRNGETQIHGPYIRWVNLQVGGLDVQLAVKEITEQQEHISYQRLADLHYRGEHIHGRTARLILRAYDSAFPSVIGYIELATPFFVNRARTDIMDAPFTEGDISWARWDKDALRRHIHLIVRIARVVVAPEFRGLGVSGLLLRHAFDFARRRWQVAGLKPLFVEMSADMLRYVPFALRAGMVYVGETEGNLHRVADDMRYLIGRFGGSKSDSSEFEKSCGICDQQISRMQAALALMCRERMGVDELISKLRTLSRSKVLREFVLFHGIAVLPKPHYMAGLSDNSHRFVCERAMQLGVSCTPEPQPLSVAPLSDAIRVVNVGISFRSQVRRTRATHAVQQAFGISPEDLSCSVAEGISFDIAPGEIVLVTGPSGSGKTTLLRAVSGTDRTLGLELTGRIRVPKDASIGVFAEPRSQKSLIELIGGTNISFGLHVLGLAGLAEAYLYLKRFRELSEGQKHRAMLAILLAQRCNVWIADDFCSCLDVVTASVVAHGLQKAARRAGATAVIATSDSSNIVRALTPDKLVVLRSSTEYQVMSACQVTGLLSGRLNQDGSVRAIAVGPRVIARILRGNPAMHVSQTNSYVAGETVLVRHEQSEATAKIVYVSSIESISFTRKLALEAGYTSVSELKAGIRRQKRKQPARGLYVVRLERLGVD